ncbi:hypothetical protein HPB47_018121 [Ixodes persulcatus]|uniref:Uncharacterized protein n=1 Tax=Ixodes persulcatus TaxID=34615 RepID=A0AC60QLK5_IXOPE|nr:hypothetical protein HPB47_018121 [Ixodes persulcatus]
MARIAASMNFAPVSDARKVTEKKAAADAQRHEEAAQKAAEAAVYDDQSKCFQLLELVQRTTLGCTGSFGATTKTTRNGRTSRRRSPVCWASCAATSEKQWKYLRDKYAKEAAKVAGTERSGCGTSDVYKPKWIYFGSLRFLTVILVLELLPRCWVDREAKGRRLLLNHLLARDVRQMADVVLINPHTFFLNREKAPKRECFTADGYHIHRILGVCKMSKLIKVHVKKKLGAQWIGVRHCLELPQIYSCSHCTLVQPLQDKRPQVVVVPELHPPPITMPASHRLPANDTILAVPDLPDRLNGEVEGEDISPEEFQCAGWQSAFTKRKSSKKCLPAESDQPANTPCGSSNGGSRTPASAKKRLVAASRMPRLLKEHFRVIVRPRGGLNVKNVSQVKIAQTLVTAAGLSFTNAAEDIICPNAMQNVLVVSTPSEHSAKTYAGVEAISIGSANYEVSSYLAAPGNTCKGIIRNIDLEFDHDQLRSLIVAAEEPQCS